MEPEKGDKRIDVTAATVAEALPHVGVTEGDTVIFHSSLSSMGNVVGGPDTVIEGFLQAVGPEGTVAAPTLWWHNTDPPMELDEWDIETSPSYVGTISETLRLRPDSLRSNHPTHSVSAIGRRAAELTRDHGAFGPRPAPWTTTAFCESSPWQRLYDWNAAICFIGVDLRVGTIRHLAEAMFTQDVLTHAPRESQAALRERLVDWKKPGVWPYISGELVDRRLTASGAVAFGRIGSATLRCIRAKTMVDELLTMMNSDDPHIWFKPDFIAWLRDARRHGHA